MDVASARRLARQLYRRSRSGDVELRADVVEGPWAESVIVTDAAGRARREGVRPVRMVFSGGKRGKQALDLSVSSEDRILSHWDGYCEANGMLRPEVGQPVTFESGSASKAMGGLRDGRVLKVGPKRAQVEFRYKTGRKTTVSLPYRELRWAPKR